VKHVFQKNIFGKKSNTKILNEMKNWKIIIIKNIKFYHFFDYIYLQMVIA